MADRCSERDKPGGAPCGEDATHYVLNYFFASKAQSHLATCKRHAQRYAGFPNFMKVRPMTARERKEGNRG